ncbi:hypothetical protein ACWGJT_31010 [Streptomyces xantholiticus]
MSDRSALELDRSMPALDIRIGGFRMTIQRVPVRLLAFLATCGGSAFTAWMTTR